MSRKNTRSSGGRKVRNKTEVSAELSITSLLDVLTIILVFLIKNVSMEAVKISEVSGIQYPTTISKEEIIKNPEVVPVKIYLDRVEIGVDGLFFGTPNDLGDTKKYDDLILFLENEYAKIPPDKKDQACLVVQADASLQCKYITQVVSVGTRADFANIYFATIQDEDWLSSYRPNLARN